MDWLRHYAPREDERRKGDFGRVVVAGGSGVYAGAPAFNALAALRAGADLVFVVAPRRAADLVAGYGPDLITHPCDAPWPEPVAVLAHEPDAIVVGGGVERTGGAHDALARIVLEAPCPLVLDAEALHVVAKRPEILRGKRALLTPHAGEFEVLTGARYPSDAAARRDAVRAAAKRFGATVLVKGLVDVASDGASVLEDPEGSPYLTKGGYGDLVAGAAGALLARGASPLDAAAGAAWLVGRAGKLAAAELGESTMASDALARLPAALREAQRAR